MSELASETIYLGDCREVMAGWPDECVQCCVTSPPYWGLRDFGTGEWQGGDPECSHSVRVHHNPASSLLVGSKATTNHAQEGFRGHCWRCGAIRVDRQLGLEPTPEAYVEGMVDVFREVRRVLRSDGTLWLNMGDCYASSVNGTRHGDTKSGFNARYHGKDYTSDKQSASGGRPPARVSDKSTLRGNGHVGGGPKLHDDRAFRDKPFNTAFGGLKPKDLVGLPWMVAFALRADGWYLRFDIIWDKKNPMPESVTDRPTRSHEYLFLLTKSPRYFYDALAIRESGREWPGRSGTFARNGDVAAQVIPGQGHAEHRADRSDRVPSGRNKRGVWTIPTVPYPEAHFATFPPALVKPCILAGTKPQDMVLDPFAGSGTTLAVAKSLDRCSVGIELNPEYVRLAERRLQKATAQIGLPLEAV